MMDNKKRIVNAVFFKMEGHKLVTKKISEECIENLIVKSI